ncbi:MAG TPA: DNA-directed RNA polymerase subunit beta', partial [Acidimicrobiia bacterium]
MPAQIFDELRIGLASNDQVRAWSYGEVKKPETINYRTLRPEKEGLFDERIFGPQRDWECYCGKYKRIRYKGIICERCGVEVTRSKVRRERMGHIELAAPVTHIWFFKGVPSRLGYLLDMSPKELEKVIYFASYIVTSVNDESRQKDLPELEEAMGDEIEVVKSEFKEWHEVRLEALEDELERMEEGGAKTQEINARRKEVEKEIKEREERTNREIELIEEAFSTFRTMGPKQLIESEQLWREIYFRYADYFEGGMGAEAVKTLLTSLDLDAEMDKLEENLNGSSQQRRQRATQRMKVVKPFWEGQNRPEDMILETVPVIPPDLRPMVQLDGGRFATSDLNDLYRRVINRNNRLKRLLDLGAPEIIVNNEKRMLQEAVDALFDNGRRGRAVTGPGNRALKSLSDMLKGKQGRFRQNLLGKRVDYSGRSVIVVGPQLKLHQCGLPKIMALELFKPFVMKRLVDLDLAQNIKAAKRMVERQRPQVWDVLSDVIQEHPVLLNRAPTLHRLGIQAFEPVLVEGKAIQIHPLVCEAFNADFDGDQMAVHLPLSAEAQAEARILMLSSNNVLSPASGRPIVTPSQDMVIGIFYLSELVEDAKGAGRTFADIDEAFMAYEIGELSLHAPIKLRLGELGGDPDVHNDLSQTLKKLVNEEPVDPKALTETTLGRALLNTAFPEDFPYINSAVIKSDIKLLIETIIERYPRSAVAATLDGIKELGFQFATRAGLTIALDDVRTPADKAEILAEYEERAEKVQNLFAKGVVTDDERRQELIEIWTEATEKVTDAMKAGLKTEQFNSLDMMVGSGARGNMMQVRQIAGMRGLVANPKGDIIPRPIISNFREGLSVLEYFISTHGARKGLADTALRTADSGYLTRRLVDVSQEMIVTDEDCETDRGIVIKVVDERGNKIRNLRSRIYGRMLADDLKEETEKGGHALVATEDDEKLRAGTIIGTKELHAIEEADVESVRVRS